jgi:hypothetical protein
MNKSTIIIIIVAVLVGFGYFYVRGGTSSDTSALLQGSSAGISNNRAGQILALLNQVNTIKIDATLFSSAIYKTLRDNTVPIPPQGVGRPNPFAPVR